MSETKSAADRIEVERGPSAPRMAYPHDLVVDGEPFAALTREHADLFDELIAAARQAEELRADGMERAVVATGDVIRRHGWKWRWPGVESDWLPADFLAPPRHDTRYECRPPQQAEPQMVAVMLPADVARQWACGDTYADDEIVAAACRAALTEGDES